MNNGLLEVFSNMKAWLLNRGISDHCPFTSSSEVNWGPKPFRSLRKWNKEVYRNFNCKIEELEAQVNHLDKLIPETNDTVVEIQSRREVTMELWKWYRRKELYWAQLAKDKWLKEGDLNTKYFHGIAAYRARWNHIGCIECGGTKHLELVMIKSLAVANYRNLFSEQYLHRPTFNNLDLKRISPEDKINLCGPIDQEKIWRAVKSCSGSTASGLDGINFNFIRKTWEILGGEVKKFIHEFWTSGVMPKQLNRAFIALIPKKEGALEFKDFRPTSMVGSFYKIVSKSWPID